MRTWMLSLAAVAGLSAFASTARADQCEWIDPDVAAKAQQLLASHPKVIAFCEPCGDKAPGQPDIASSVEVGSPQRTYKDVRINGTAVDLAYTYVQTSPTEYQNLALLAGCEAHDVSPSLKVADETPTGVLIVADTTPIEPPHVIAPVAAEPEPPAPAPPHVFVFSTHTRETLPWLAIVLAGAASFVMSLGGILVFARFRRRRTMKPRANDLRADD